jgi:hypothetical protein
MGKGEGGVRGGVSEPQLGIHNLTLGYSNSLLPCMCLEINVKVQQILVV